MLVADSSEAQAFLLEYEALCLKHGMKVGNVNGVAIRDGWWVACVTVASREEIAGQLGEMHGGALYADSPAFISEDDED
jgi:hypothetical protein